MPARKQSNPPAAPRKARQCRFVVRSAEEAVARVRETLGPEARVVSVKQVKGEGLQRFLSAPRLEVIARLDPPKPEPAPAAEAPEPETGSPDATDSEAKDLPDSGGVTREEPANRLNCGTFLERAGLPEVLLGRFESDPEWREICAMDLRDGLPRVVRTLREQMKRRHSADLPLKAAFMGGPGAGKTTALCKLLARDVFLNGRRPQVLRLELDKPHLDDGLLLYCDVLGVPCTRSADEIDFGEEQSVYIDIPGFDLGDHAEQERIRAALDTLGIEGRILVLNAAYETGILQKFGQCGQRLGTGFQILTHLDELDACGKLWAFLFDPDRALLFFSNGQNIASDRVDDPFGYLMERTFPR